MTRGIWRVVVVAVVTSLVAQIGYAVGDRQGCKDYPLLTRLDGFFIEGCKEQPFSTYEFSTEKGKKAVEGHFISISYRRPSSAPEMSGIEVIQNYLNAITAIGGKVMQEGRYSGTTKVVVEDREVWIAVLPHGKRAYRLDIIEKEKMKQQVVADAAALLADLDRVGHAVLHGVLFDTDKDTIKPESDAALGEIAKLLKANPRMSAFIVGHTDMSGSFEHNLDLARRRAAAVVEALATKHGISKTRLAAQGVGPLAPVASNASEAGRTLNRRVELVKR